MKVRALLLILVIGSALADNTSAAENPLKPDPIHWCRVPKPQIEVLSKPGSGEKEVAKLMRGMLVPAFESKKTGKGEWLRVVAIDLARMTPCAGWIEAAAVQIIAPDAYPHDDKILALSGAPFVEDFAAENTAVARLLLRTADAGDVLICYLGTEVLPHTRLQLFLQSGARYKAGPAIDIPFSEMKSPIASLEALDLAGDGNEFLVTREPYASGPQVFGMDLLVRRFDGNRLITVGKIPIAARNFASYPPRLQIAEPDEANIGQPGTDTKGEIEFRARGQQTDIAWKGEIRFHALGREKPLETIPLERVWTWNGNRLSLRQ